MSVVVGALGSIIGYLGAEAATESFFERLLWPQRFYNDASVGTLCKLALFMPMTGPLHRAALDSLDTFRANGLYRGIRRGDMLGTTFFHDSGTKNYRRPSAERRDEAQESRNAFWVQVLRDVNYPNCTASIGWKGAEGGQGKRVPSFRAMQLVHHLTLQYAPNVEQAGANAIPVTEYAVTWRTVIGIFASELVSLAVAFAAAFGTPFKTWWVAVYLVLPLLLKMISLLVSVRRDSITPRQKIAQGPPVPEDTFYEIDDGSHGFSVIQGPSDVVEQFFKHYGHPKRDGEAAGRRDRVREILSICLVYAFVLYFPAGLIGSVWMKQKTQLLWLSFQVYTIFAMHIVRILGWDGSGRTEGRIASYLLQKKTVWLKSPQGYGVVATLETTDVPSVSLAKREVNAIIEGHLKMAATNGDATG